MHAFDEQQPATASRRIKVSTPFSVYHSRSTSFPHAQRKSKRNAKEGICILYNPKMTAPACVAMFAS